MRLNTELGFFSNPADAMRLFKTPSIAISKPIQLLRFLGYAIGDPTATYERDAGIAKKGDNKAFINFLKLMGYTGHNMHPDQAIKILELSKL
jgi:hypothetical protein